MQCAGSAWALLEEKELLAGSAATIEWMGNASQRGEGARGETNGGFNPSSRLQ